MNRLILNKGWWRLQFVGENGVRFDLPFPTTAEALRWADEHEVADCELKPAEKEDDRN